jgi:hypothetical protein
MPTKLYKNHIYLIFKYPKIVGCYNSTPLKMNLVLEIRKMMIKEIVALCLYSILILQITSFVESHEAVSQILTD